MPTTISLTSEQDAIISSKYTDLFKILLAEFLGTFILVFIGGSAAALSIQQEGVYLNIGFAFGLALIFLIFIFGSHSSSNFNPAVSFGLALTGRLDWLTMLLFWIVQIIAGIAAAALITYFFW